MTPSLFVPHRRPGPMLRGQLLDRPNRFLGIVRLQQPDPDPSLAGEAPQRPGPPPAIDVEAHIADRGRLEGILFPGAEVYVVAAPGEARRTAYTLVCARAPAEPPSAFAPLVCLDPAFANRLVRVLLEARTLPGLPLYMDTIAAEVRLGASRFDFALALPGGRRLWLEVKSCAVARGQSALFPDAPSERAARHCRELAALARQGTDAAIVLVTQRPEVAEIRPHPVDPRFAEALAEAQEAGVLLLGTAFSVDLEGFRHAGPRRVLVTPP